LKKGNALLLLDTRTLLNKIRTYLRGLQTNQISRGRDNSKKKNEGNGVLPRPHAKDLVTPTNVVRCIGFFSLVTVFNTVNV